MAEINDAELAELRKLQAFHKSLYDDSAVGMDFRKLIKKKYPNATIPELDAIEHVDKAATDLRKELDERSTGALKRLDDFLEEQRKAKEEAQVADFKSTLAKIVKERGYTEDGEKKLIELMKERGITNPEDAAIVFEASQPKQKPAPRQYSTRMNFIDSSGKDDEAFKQLMNDPEQFMMDEMTAALAEPQEQ